MDNLILVGGGGHCKSCIDVIESENKFKIYGILDVKEKIGQKVLGYEIIGTDEDIEKYIKDGFYFLITIGHIKTAEIRAEIFKKLKKNNAKIATIISPLAYVSKHSKIAEGTIIMHQALINAGVTVGENCIINSKALLEHDVKIENNCHISTGAVINGEVTVGEESFVGSNSTIIQCLNLPKSSFIKAGSLVK